MKDMTNRASTADSDQGALDHRVSSRDRINSTPRFETSLSNTSLLEDFNQRGPDLGYFTFPLPYESVIPVEVSQPRDQF